MTNSNAQFEAQQSHAKHLHFAQSIIDSLVDAKNNFHDDVVSGYFGDRNIYAIDFDSRDGVVLSDEVHGARIMPKRVPTKKTTSTFDVSKIEVLLIVLAKKLFNVLLIGLKFVVSFLVWLDVVCEVIIVKGNEYLATTSKNISAKKEKTKIKNSGSVQLQILPKKKVLQHTKVLVVSDNTVKIIPITYTKRAYSDSFEVVATKKFKKKSTISQVFVILYRKLRYGK